MIDEAKLAVLTDEELARQPFDELVAALRQTPTASLHLHVPLHSGDDGILRAMDRRYSAAQYLAKRCADSKTRVRRVSRSLQPGG